MELTKEDREKFAALLKETFPWLGEEDTLDDNGELEEPEEVSGADTVEELDFFYKQLLGTDFPR